MDRTIKRSPGLKDILKKTCRDPFAIIISIPEIDINTPIDCKKWGFSLFMIQEKRMVMTGIVATTSEIFVAVVYCAPKYKIEL